VKLGLLFVRACVDGKAAVCAGTRWLSHGGVVVSIPGTGCHVGQPCKGRCNPSIDWSSTLPVPYVRNLQLTGWAPGGMMHAAMRERGFAGLVYMYLAP
jgi:hypothetical protein